MDVEFALAGSSRHVHGVWHVVAAAAAASRTVVCGDGRTFEVNMAILEVGVGSGGISSRSRGSSSSSSATTAETQQDNEDNEEDAQKHGNEDLNGLTCGFVGGVLPVGGDPAADADAAECGVA